MGTSSIPGTSSPMAQNRRRVRSLRNRNRFLDIDDTPLLQRASLSAVGKTTKDNQDVTIAKKKPVICSSSNLEEITVRTSSDADSSSATRSKASPPTNRPDVDKGHLESKDPDGSFHTQETMMESDSDEDTNDSNLVSNEDEENSTSSFGSRRGGVRFADEVGLPIKSIRHYECDRRHREHSELLILCMSPEMKKFEFLHVGYHRDGENSNHTVNDLLGALPSMCTDNVFSNKEFVALYRNNGVDKGFENMCSSGRNRTISGNGESPSLLKAYDLRENELIVAAIRGSSERDVLSGIGPLLSNEKILKTLKRARRSRRGLKFLTTQRSDDTIFDGRTQPSRTRLFRKRPSAHTNESIARRNMDESKEIFFEDCSSTEAKNDFHKSLFVGVLSVSVGTILFSALGI